MPTKFAQHNWLQYLRFLYRWQQARNCPPHMVSYERHLHEMFKGSKKADWEQLKIDLAELQKIGAISRQKKYGWEFGLTEKGVQVLINNGVPESQIRGIYKLGEQNDGGATVQAASSGDSVDAPPDTQVDEGLDGKTGREPEDGIDSGVIPSTANIGSNQDDD